MLITNEGKLPIFFQYPGAKPIVLPPGCSLDPEHPLADSDISFVGVLKISTEEKVPSFKPGES